MIEILLLIVVGTILQLATINYYFVRKRKYMQGLLNDLREGEPS